MLFDKSLEGDYGIRRKTWQNWRSAGSGPPYFKIGARCLYRRGDVEAWLAARRIEPRR